ncbi:MAG: hypothetical protein ACRER7_05305, partial [Gammaproteobacteria bacterium]
DMGATAAGLRDFSGKGGSSQRKSRLVWRANDLSGFVARGLSGFIVTFKRGGHEKDRLATGDPEDEISRSV